MDIKDTNLEALTSADLVALNQDLGRQSDAIREQRIAINAVLRARMRGDAKEPQPGDAQASGDLPVVSTAGA